MSGPQIGVLGAGAFGTALAAALATARPGRGEVVLWARDRDQAAQIEAARENARRLPGVALPPGLRVTADLEAALAPVMLLAVPMQETAGFLEAHGARLGGRAVVACSKGVDLASLRGPSALLAAACPGALPAVLTGPSFAADIARGLPTALTLACADPARGAALQAALSTPALRLYRTTDVAGAELGGALKNVVAIAAGVVAGAGLGDSARAAIITRGFAEMQRLAARRGARPETLAGLSGLGDLVLTCTSGQSRNFRHGHALGAGEAQEAGVTVEGAATARALARLAAREGIDLPVTQMVAALVAAEITVEAAVAALLSRPLKEE